MAAMKRFRLFGCSEMRHGEIFGRNIHNQFRTCFPGATRLVESWIIPPKSMKSGQFGQRMPCLTRPNAVNTSYGYDGGNLIEEANSNGAVIAR
jgi:hypothetical protein